MSGVCKCDTSERVLDDVIFAASGAKRHTKPGQLFHRHTLEVGHDCKRSTASSFLDLCNESSFFRPVLHEILLTMVGFYVLWNAEPKNLSEQDD